MSKVNIVAELLEKHSDSELIEHLYRVSSGVLKNYKISLEKGDSNILWANLGDIELVTSVLQAIYKREEAKLAQAEK